MKNFTLGRHLLSVAPFFITPFAWAFPTLDEAALERFGNSSEWKGILQYQKGMLGIGTESSEVASKNFFYAENGNTDSVAELKATIAAFQNTKLNDATDAKYMHPICLYPARLQLILHADLGLKRSNFPMPYCKEYEAYRSRVRGRHASVVFSSYYTGSASSIFGHSFLRFAGETDNELFDAGINFAANPSTTNPVLYAVYGLLGVFPATFSAQPFYYKVREYNDFESRDLWTYNLRLTDEEKDILINHLWELGNVSFAYYYFNQNCSYQILRAIEGAVPRIKFYQHRAISVIPSDSIKELYAYPDLVTGISFRPSSRSSAYYRWSLLNDEERDTLLKSLHTQASPEAGAGRTAKMMDALIDAIDLNYAEKIVAKDEKITVFKNKILEERALMPEITPDLHVPPPALESPEKGHGSKRVTLSYGSHHLDLDLRASHHDLLDPSIGYPEFLHIDFGRVAARYLTDTKKFQLKELTMVDLTALSIAHPLYVKFSYSAYVGMQRDFLNRPAISLRGGVGNALPLFGRHAFFFFTQLIPSFSSDYPSSKFRFTFEPNANLLFEISATTKMMFSGFGGVSTVAAHPFEGRGTAEFRHTFYSTLGMGGAYTIGAVDGIHFEQWTAKLFYYF